MTMSYGNQRGGFGALPRIIMAGVLVVMAYAGYYCSTQPNPITGEKQHVAMTPEQETALGLQSAPEMIAQMGGEIETGPAAQAVRAMGQRLVAALGPKNPYKFDYHLLADNQTINAFALPGGQVFITRALYDRLETEAQLAGVLGHETGHVVHRHGAQQMANQQFYQRLAGAAAVGSGDYNTAQIAQYVAQVRELSYSRKDELEADQSGLELMTALGYTPQAQAEVMAILKNASGGRGNGPDWMSTHPNPDARIEVIKEWIARHYPNGIPGTLTEGGRLH